MTYGQNITVQMYTLFCSKNISPMPTCWKRVHGVQVNIVNMLLCKKVEETVWTSLTALSMYLSQIWNHHPPNEEEEKKLSQRIIKIWVFWDVMLCQWASDAYFNGRLKTTNSVMQYHIPVGPNPQLQHCENLTSPKNIVKQSACAENSTL